MHVAASTRPVTGAAIALSLLLSACGSSAAAPATPAQTAAPTAVPTAAPTAAPSAAARVLDTSTMGDAFPIAMRVPVPENLVKYAKLAPAKS